MYRREVKGPAFSRRTYYVLFYPDCLCYVNLMATETSVAVNRHRKQSHVPGAYPEYGYCIVKIIVTIFQTSVQYRKIDKGVKIYQLRENTIRLLNDRS